MPQIDNSPAPSANADTADQAGKLAWEKPRFETAPIGDVKTSPYNRNFVPDGPFCQS